MKKLFLFVTAALLLTSCSNNNKQVQALQTQVDTLQSHLNQTYPLGFGEMMTNVQIHHEKLWFAGENQNWDLADYEIKELQETFADIQKYQSARSESKMVPMILPALDSVSTTISMKSKTDFTKAFKFLTNTCNDCHTATDHSYNVIIIPKTLPFSNQQFTKK